MLQNDRGAHLPPPPLAVSGVVLTTEGGKVGTIFDPKRTRTVGVFIQWHTDLREGSPQVPVIVEFTNPRAVDELIRSLRKHRRDVWGKN